MDSSEELAKSGRKDRIGTPMADVQDTPAEAHHRSAPRARCAELAAGRDRWPGVDHPFRELREERRQGAAH
jgi:hypothetical protein